LYAIISFFADCCPCQYRSWESGVLWFLCTIENCPLLFTVCLCSLAGFLGAVAPYTYTVLAELPRSRRELPCSGLLHSE